MTETPTRLVNALDPSFIEPEIARLYGWQDVRCELLPPYQIWNVYEVWAQGQHALLRMPNHGLSVTESDYGPSKVQAPLRVLRHLKKHLRPGIVPTPIPQLTGDDHFAIECRQGTLYGILTDYLVGRPIGSWFSESTAFQAGALLGQVHEALSKIPNPSLPDKQYFIQQIELTTENYGYLIPWYTGSEDQKDSTVLWLAEVKSRLTDVILNLPTDSGLHGYIHGHVTTGNIVHTSHSLALINFDISTIGWFAYDVASMLLHIDFWNLENTLKEMFLSGYYGVRVWNEFEYNLLPTFVAIASAFTLGNLGIEVDSSGRWQSPYDRRLEKGLELLRKAMQEL